MEGLCFLRDGCQAPSLAMWLSAFFFTGESGSVDRNSMQEELNYIRVACSRIHPDNIYVCVEAGKYRPRNYKDSNRLETDITNEGRMTDTRFREWVTDLDDQLSEPSLLILDSAPSHNNIEYRDPINKTPWNNLTIVCLQKAAMSITQPLDAGVISMFKRRYLHMLCRQTSIVPTLGEGNDIPRDVVWSIIPHAWSFVTAETIWHCFLNMPILPENIRCQLENYIPEWREQHWRLTIYPTEARYRKRMEVYFSELIASVIGETVHTVHAAQDMEEKEIVERRK